MSAPNNLPSEETLDPQDWSAMRALGHRMVDDMFSYLETVRERPVWQPIPDEVKTRLNAPLPTEPQEPEAVYADFVRDVLPYPMGNIHPRFWSWVIGTGTPLGMMADMLAAGMNSNLGGGDHAAVYVEEQVIAWCKAIFGFSDGSSGLLTSGASMANLIGLTVARNTGAGYDVRKRGVQGGLRIYGSQEMHSSIQRAVELLGLGTDALRKIPLDADYRMNIDALRAAIAADRAAGLRPFCVVGNAGSVNTGGFDDLNALADLCAEEGLWLHVDGAFGGLVALAPSLRHLVAGIERADSLVFDMHKWMSVPYEAACVLVRDRNAHYRSFTLTPDYLKRAERGLAAGLWPSDYDIQLSRGFKALKIWMAIKEHGVERFGRLIEQNVEQARYLAGRVDATPELQRLAPVPLNVVCFRYFVPDMEDAVLDALNQELLVQLQEHGIATLGITRVNGVQALRVCVVNHRSRREDFDLLVREVTRLGAALAAEGVR